MKKPEIPIGEETRLDALLALNILDTAPEERFDRLTRMAKQTLGVSMALVSLVDRDRQWFKSSVGLDVRETPREVSFCGHAILAEEAGFDVIYQSTKDLQLRVRGNFPTDFVPGLDWFG